MKTNKNEGNKLTKNKLLAIGTVVLPFVAFIIASLLNPHGYASGNPFYVLIFGLLILYVYWPVTVGIVVFLIIFSRITVNRSHKPFQGWAIPTLFLVSLMYSIYLYYVVSTARENEFTG